MDQYSGLIGISWNRIQLVFSNFYLGIAQGALDFASKYTVTSTRAWPFGGDVSIPKLNRDGVY